MTPTAPPAAPAAPAAPASAPSTLSSIVVGTDFTPGSSAALAQAIRIAAWSGAKVHVVHVIDTQVVIELEEALSPMQQGIRDCLVDDAQLAWAAFAASLPGAAGLPVEVAINNRIVGILGRARENRADLLVMGAHGDRRTDAGVGSVAGACVRKSMTDVLMVRDATGPTGAAPFKTIVAAVDFSPTSLRAVRRAAAFAAKDGAELHLLHVFQSPWRQLHPRATTPAPPGLQQHREGLERRLTEFCRPALEPSAIPAGAVRSVVYDCAGHRSGIVEYAGRVRADLIVLGTRGRTNLRDLLLGGTAEKAIEESRCSILVVKPEGFEHPLAAEPQPRPVQMRTLS